MNSRFGIAIHGGAGTILKSAMTPQRENLYKEALTQAIHNGYSILESGGTALDAVESAVMNLEDCELFNAGRGSVFTETGTHEMDASIMCGKTLNAGAVALLRHIKNPIHLARHVMEHSDHVFMAGEGAEAFAFSRAFEKMPPSYFFNELRYQQWLSVKGTDRMLLDHDIAKEEKYSTVGAVALDREGNLASATSTGGMTNKKPGRIGDTPLIGSGTYAENGVAAVSCTGSGEYFIRLNVAFRLCSWIKYGRIDLGDAAHRLIHKYLTEIGGDGGLIAIDSKGHVAMPFNTEGMYRANKVCDQPLFVSIY